jgi:hypothetical protein
LLAVLVGASASARIGHLVERCRELVILIADKTASDKAFSAILF